MSGVLDYKLSFEISPIYLTGSSTITQGIAGSVLALTSLIGLTSGLSLDDFFLHFVPMPGATIIEGQVPTYPFANQAVAGNAWIAQPLQIAMKMYVPVKGPGGYWLKYSLMQSLRDTLYQHSTHGGTYTVVTPSYPYTSCLLTRFSDITGGESAQAQIAWQLDFTRPLLTLEEATAAQNTLTSKISSGAQITTGSSTQINTGVTSSGLTSGAGGQAVTSDSTSGLTQ